MITGNEALAAIQSTINASFEGGHMRDELYDAVCAILDDPRVEMAAASYDEEQQRRKHLIPVAGVRAMMMAMGRDLTNDERDAYAGADVHARCFDLADGSFYLETSGGRMEATVPVNGGDHEHASFFVSADSDEWAAY